MTILLKIFLKKANIFSCDFKIIDGSIRCTTKFYTEEISFFFFLTLLDQTLCRFFGQKFARVEHTICDCN